MRVFVTGASGHIGSAVVPELLKAGHEVTGLARSDASAAAVRALGARVHRGDLTDLDGLRTAAADADAVVHLAYDHAQMRTGDRAGAAAADLEVVRAFGDALEGTGKTLLGVGMGRADGPMATMNPRSAVAAEVFSLGDRGVRPLLVAIPPVTHSDLDKHGFIPMYVAIARRTGVAGYLGDGSNTWPAGHTLDVAGLYRLALEKAPAGAQLYGATEAGVTHREIAETVARHLGVPARSVPEGEAAAHFGHFQLFMRIDILMPNDETRGLVGWEPSHPGLIADLDEGHYFAAG